MAELRPTHSGTGHKLNVSFENGFFIYRVELCLTKIVGFRTGYGTQGWWYPVPSPVQRVFHRSKSLHQPFQLPRSPHGPGMPQPWYSKSGRCRCWWGDNKQNAAM